MILYCRTSNSKWLTSHAPTFTSSTSISASTTNNNNNNGLQRASTSLGFSREHAVTTTTTTATTSSSTLSGNQVPGPEELVRMRQESDAHAKRLEAFAKSASSSNVADLLLNRAPSTERERNSRGRVPPPPPPRPARRSMFDDDDEDNDDDHRYDDDAFEKDDGAERTFLTRPPPSQAARRGQDPVQLRRVSAARTIQRWFRKEKVS